jgi:peptidoglycan hydrolase-like protein with peptidoglycan-binding domain
MALKPKVLNSEASTTEIPVPGETKTYTKVIVKSPASTREIDLPSETGTYTTTSLNGGGTYSEWAEILCESKLTTAKIIQIQRALKAAGYDPGPIDDIIGPRTRAKLLEYQKAKGLPQGNLNIETLRSLGVEK